MAGGGALEILGQIQALVSDKLQVVSYKWLSRNFSVSSNYAKRLLQEFVEKHGSELEVIYTMSGWLKKNPQTYGIRLASGLNLAEVKQKFKDNCSVQVYSVQACIPKDLAALWSAEFVQAEELFNQPSTAENCFRDNRFCGVSNSFVKRIIDGNLVSVTPPQTKRMINDQFAQPPQQAAHVGLSSSENAVQSCTAITTGDKSRRVAPKITDQTSNPYGVKESAPTAHDSKRKDQNEKASSGSVGSIATLWGRATSKSKTSNPAKDSTNDSNNVPNIAHTAEAQICAQELEDAFGSDNDGHDLKESNGAGNRKRRVIMDFSDDDDEEEKVLSLASPEPPNGQLVPDSLRTSEKIILEKKNINFEEQKGGTLEDKQVDTKEQSSRLSSEDDIRAESKNMVAGISLQDKTKSSIPEGPADTNKKDVATNPASTSPKRRKVVRTRIDERGREVNEVVWEGEATGRADSDNNMTTTESGNRAMMTNKAPAAVAPAASNPSTNPVSKAGNKKAAKGGGKDPKQGNIMSFFKKV